MATHVSLWFLVTLVNRGVFWLGRHPCRIAHTRTNHARIVGARVGECVAPYSELKLSEVTFRKSGVFLAQLRYRICAGAFMGVSVLQSR